VDQAIEDARTAALALLTSDDDALTYGDPIYIRLEDEHQELYVTRSLIRVCKYLLDNDSEAIRNKIDDELRGATAYALFKATENTPDLSFELLLTAAQCLDHPKMWPDLESYHYHVGDFAQGLQYHLRDSRRGYRHAAGDTSAVSDIRDSLARVYRDNDELPTTKKQCRSVVRVFTEELETGPDKNEVDAVFVPTYVSFIRVCLCNKKMYSDLLEPAERLLQCGSNDPEVLWDYAYAHHCLDHKQEAEAAYRRLLAVQGDNASALHNLSLLVHDSGRIEEALSLSEKAASLSRDNKSIVGWHGKLQARKAEQDRETQQREDFLRTAVQRWPRLDYFKRQLVCTLSLISGWQGFDHLSLLSGIDEKYLPGHMRALEEQGMITYPSKGTFQLNPYILPLVERENTHAVVTKIIHGDESIAFRPIFNSRQEYTIYHILIGLFPNHLVFPNMALQTVFQYERMKSLLDSAVFGFFLRTQVRFCVTSTANYLPLIAFELDNDFHDADDQKQRDAKKDRIFEVGGVPLLRLRGYGKPTETAIRNQIIQDIQSLGDRIRQMPKKSPVLASLERELDFENFGAQHDSGSSQQWLTVSQAASISGANPGVITRAVDTGELMGNGLTDRNRRIDAVDLAQWILRRTKRPEPEESDAQVERLVRKHVKD
jgi:tetratricopeptide (TPR) repeat protein